MTSEGELNPPPTRPRALMWPLRMLAHPRNGGLLCTVLYMEKAAGYLPDGVSRSDVELERVSPDHHWRATDLKTYSSV